MKSDQIDFERGNNNMKIEQVVPEDIAEVANLAEHRSAEVVDKWCQQAAEGNLVMFAVRDGDKVIGSVNLLLDRTDTPQPVAGAVGDKTAMVNALGINEEYRGRGLGTKLMDACEGYVINHPELPQKIALGVEVDNKIARTMYEQRGYQYTQMDGKDTYETSWPEVDANGNKQTYHAECLLMVKDLS